MSAGNIEDSFFYWKFAGTKAVILFPALTTPAIISDTDKLTIIIAVHDDSFQKLEACEGKAFKPGVLAPRLTALKFHAQLLLVPWGNGHKSKFDTADEAKRFYNGINSWQHTIYQGLKKVCDEVNKGEDSAYKAWYLSKLKQQEHSVEGMDASTSYPPAFVEGLVNGQKKPFGVLAEAAVEMLCKGNFLHLFQLEFDNFPQRSSVNMQGGEMYELVWLDMPLPPEHEKFQYGNPGDVLLVKNFEENINEGVLEQNKDTAMQPLPPGYQCEDLPLYRLLNVTAAQDADAPSGSGPSGVPLNALAYMTQKGGELIYSYHPVFFKNEIKTVGAVADIHLSSRQALYKLVKAQVIPGASIKDSPYVGLMAHESLRSTRYLMKEIGKNSDMLLIAGDIQDYRRNLHPKKCAEKITNTAALWAFLNFTEDQTKDMFYEEHIDGLMMLELILTHYSELKRPVFFVAGNHEGYHEPYGISPRILGVRLNDGIPSDHNLTIYEAVLLFGEKYAAIDKKFNFSAKVMSWIYQVFTPWKDFFVTHRSLNLVGLGWGNKEDFIKTLLVGGTGLPRATDSINREQLKLVQRCEDREAPVSMLCSHFTYVNYDGTLPLLEENGVLHAGNITKTPWMAAEDKTNTGSFTDNLGTVADLLEEQVINYTISGHSHRGGAYAFTNVGVSGFWDRVRSLRIDRVITVASAVQPNPDQLLHAGGEWKLPPLAIALVSGSTGPFPTQNIQNELKQKGLDSPQGLILNIADNTVRFIPWEGGTVEYAPGSKSGEAGEAEGKTPNPRPQNGPLDIEKPVPAQAGKEKKPAQAAPGASGASQNSNEAPAVTTYEESGKPRLAVVTAYLRDTDNIQPFSLLHRVETCNVGFVSVPHYAPAGNMVLNLNTKKAQLMLTDEFVEVFGGNPIGAVTLHGLFASPSRQAKMLNSTHPSLVINFGTTPVAAAVSKSGQEGSIICRNKGWVVHGSIARGNLFRVNDSMPGAITNFFTSIFFSIDGLWANVKVKESAEQTKDTPSYAPLSKRHDLTSPLRLPVDERIKTNSVPGLLRGHYDLHSPWCMPVKEMNFSPSSVEVGVLFDNRELPDFFKLSQLFPSEFKESEKRQEYLYE